MVELSLDDGKKLRLDDDGMKLDDGKGNSFSVDSKSGALTIEAAAMAGVGIDASTGPVKATSSSNQAEANTAASGVRAPAS